MTEPTDEAMVWWLKVWYTHNPRPRGTCWHCDQPPVVKRRDTGEPYLCEACAGMVLEWLHKMRSFPCACHWLLPTYEDEMTLRRLAKVGT